MFQQVGIFGRESAFFFVSKEGPLSACRMPPKTRGSSTPKGKEKQPAKKAKGKDKTAKTPAKNTEKATRQTRGRGKGKEVARKELEVIPDVDVPPPPPP